MGGLHLVYALILTSPWYHKGLALVDPIEKLGLGCPTRVTPIIKESRQVPLTVCEASHAFSHPIGSQGRAPQAGLLLP